MVNQKEDKDVEALHVYGSREAWQNQPNEFFVDSMEFQISALKNSEQVEKAKELMLYLIGFGKDSEDIDTRIAVARTWNELIHSWAELNQEQRLFNEINDFLIWIDSYPLLWENTEVRQEVFDVLAAKAAWWQKQAMYSQEAETYGTNGICVEPDMQVPISQPLSEENQKLKEAVGEILDRFAADMEDDIRHNAATWLYNLGHYYRVHACYTESEIAYRRLWVLFGKDPSADIAEDIAASGMMNLGYLLLAILDRPEEAIAVYQEVIAAHEHSISPTMRTLLSKIYASHQMAVTQLSKRGQCTQEWVDVAMQAEEREQFRAWIEEADDLQEAERYEEAIEKYVALIARYPQPKGAELRMKISDAMTEQAYCLQMLEKWQESVEILNVHLEEFETERHMLIEKDVAMNLFNKSVALHELERFEEQKACLQAIIQRWSDSNVPDIIYHCAKAGWAKGDAEEDSGQIEEAEQTYRQTVRYLEGETEEIALIGATVCINLAMLLCKKGDLTEAQEYIDCVFAKQADFSTEMGQEELKRAEQVRRIIEKLQIEKENELPTF